MLAKTYQTRIASESLYLPLHRHPSPLSQCPLSSQYYAVQRSSQFLHYRIVRGVSAINDARLVFHDDDGCALVVRTSLTSISLT